MTGGPGHGDPLRDEQPRQASSVTCEHHFVSIHQPDMPVYWIRRCSLCGTFDAADLREQLVTQPGGAALP